MTTKFSAGGTIEILNPSSDDELPVVIPQRTELCQMCKEAVFKYKCPACAIRTCSLPCVKKHKVDCSGVAKDPVEKVGMSHF